METVKNQPPNCIARKNAINTYQKGGVNVPAAGKEAAVLQIWRKATSTGDTCGWLLNCRTPHSSRYLAGAHSYHAK